MNDKFDVKIRDEQREKGIYLSVTHNGVNWEHIEIIDPEYEISKIMKVLKHYFIQIERERLRLSKHTI